MSEAPGSRLQTSGVFATGFAVAVLIPLVAFAQSDYPFIRATHPVAVQIGQATEVEIVGTSGPGRPTKIEETHQVFTTGDGLSAELVPHPMAVEGQPAPPPPKTDRRKVKLTVAAETLPGQRDIRLITPKGASSLATVWLTRDPVLMESAANDTMETAQPISLPQTVCGTFEKAEDVDYYKFTISEPTSLTFHVQSQRLSNRTVDLLTHGDPLIALRNASGSVLALNDNYHGPDPLLHYHFATAGEYFLEIRDVRYQGNASWQYAVEINNRPFVTTASPVRLVAGKSQTVELQGFGLGNNPSCTVETPADSPEGFTSIAPVINGQTLNPIVFYVSKLPEAVEPSTDNNSPKGELPAIEFPSGIVGKLEAKGDADCWRFEAKKGEMFAFELVARRAGSSLDGVFRIYNDGGGLLVESDDGMQGRYRSFDSVLEWTAPADGKFTLELRDNRKRGGGDFPYLIKAERAPPNFYLELDTDKTWIAPGISAPILVRAYRLGGFTGEIRLRIEGLPEGVTASSGKILAEQKDGSIILTAADNAPQKAGNVQVTGTARHKLPDGQEREIVVAAQPLTELAAPGGPRAHNPASMHTVSVNEPGDIRRIKLSVNQIVLKPGESQKVEIDLERRDGFDANMELSTMYEHLGNIFGGGLPPGVTIDPQGSRMLCGGKETKGWITFKAAPDAKPLPAQQTPILANCIVIFHLKTCLAAEPFTITIAPP